MAHQLFGTPYQPKGHGMVERALRSLKKIYQGLMHHDEPSSWEDYLQQAIWCYNVAVNRSIGMSPYEATFGSTPRIPNTPAKLLLEHHSIPSRIEEVQAAQERALKSAIDTYMKVVKKRLESGKVTFPHFKVDEIVSVYTPPAVKSTPLWTPGWKIVKQLNVRTYLVKHPVELTDRKVDALDIRKYNGSRYGETELAQNRLPKGSFLVGRIITHNETKEGTRYLVHWLGYDSSHDSWEPDTDIQRTEAFKEYQAKIQAAASANRSAKAGLSKNKQSRK